jgi:GNAT superfamily N-acetyltransferase
MGEANEAHLMARADSGDTIGLLAYVDGQPAGWCSIGPQAHYRRFYAGDARSNDRLIACLFLAASRRHEGVAFALLTAATAFATANGARCVEAVPRGWRPDDNPATMEAVLRLFRHAGFIENDDPNAMTRFS